MSDIQVVGGFVQQQPRRLLRQRARQVHPLLFTAGQPLPIAIGQVADAHLLHRLPGEAAILGTKTAPAADMGQTPQQYRLLHRQRESAGGGLLEKSDAPGAFPRGKRGDLAPFQPNAAAGGGLQPGQQLEQRGFTAAVDAEHAGDLTGQGAETEVFQHRARAHSPTYPLGAQTGLRFFNRHALTFRYSNSRNTGTPNSAVNTPTGSSRGANSVLASVSAATANKAPHSALAGNS